MKNLLLTIVVFSVLLLIGCQENSITDPIQETGIQKTDDPSVNTGTIVLEGMLQDPHPIMNSYYIIMGEIQYQHTLQVLDPIPPTPQYLVSLTLSLNADFKYFCTVCSPSVEDQLAGFISEVSEEIVTIGENDGSILEKTYTIEGREDDMILKCRYLVTTDGVELNEMWLELQSVSFANVVTH